MNATEMKVRFHAARVELDNAWKDPTLVRAQAAYDALRAQESDLHAKVRSAGDKLNDLKQPIAALQEELALLARALGGKTALDARAN